MGYNEEFAAKISILPGTVPVFPIGKGDREVNTKANQTTDWSLRLEVRKVGTNIYVYYMYRVMEMKGDYTTLQMSGEVLIDPNSYPTRDYRIPPPTALIVEHGGTVYGKSHNWNNGGAKGFIKNCEVKVDGPTSDDRGAIGFKADILIPYEYVVPLPPNQCPKCGHRF